MHDAVFRRTSYGEKNLFKKGKDISALENRVTVHSKAKVDRTEINKSTKFFSLLLKFKIYRYFSGISSREKGGGGGGGGSNIIL